MSLDVVTIKLQYFKESGKFYAEGELEIPKYWVTKYMFSQIYKYVRTLMRHSQLPGLVPNHSAFTVYVTGEDVVPQILHSSFDNYSS